MTHLLRRLSGFTLFAFLVDRDLALEHYFGNLDWLVRPSRDSKLA